MTATDVLLGSITAVVRRAFAASGCSIALLDGPQTHLDYVAADGVAADRIVGVRLPVDRGIAGWSVSAVQPIEIADVANDPRWARDVAEAAGYIPTRIVVMPMTHDDEVLGVLQVIDPEAERDIELLAQCARHAALVVTGRPPAGPLDPSTARLTRELSDLRAADRDAAMRLLGEFLAYVRSRAG